jgi:hypothetical protein
VKVQSSKVTVFGLSARNERLLSGTVTNWVITNAYPLTNGGNPVSLTALDRLTNLVATTNITITKQ